VNPVVVIDYGMGNLRSIANALGKVGASVDITSDPSRVAKAQRLVLPGVGAFGRSMEELAGRELIGPISEAVDRGVPLLGICLGFQVLFEASTEFGDNDGLGLMAGRCDRFDDTDLIVPHVGWNRVEPRRSHPLFDGLESGGYFYFVHSFRPESTHDDDVLATTEYGDDFVCSVHKGSVVGTQFHPEKSGRLGMKMLTNFMAWNPS
jgi:glutamine amidotransferase